MTAFYQADPRLGLSFRALWMCPCRLSDAPNLSLIGSNPGIPASWKRIYGESDFQAAPLVSRPNMVPHDRVTSHFPQPSQ